MSAITNTTQLSVFSLVRSALTANLVLSSKFTNANIYQYEPKQKQVGFNGFPYIWVNIPELEAENTTFNSSVRSKKFSATLVLRVEYQARDNFLNYANAIVDAIEDYESTFQSSGYYDVKCVHQDTDSNTVIDQKELVEGVFEISWRGFTSHA